MANIITTTGKTSFQSLIQNRQERNKTFSEKSFAAKFQGAFVFDVTGSMFDYFDVCRENIPEISREIKKQIPESEFAVGYFRNHGDEQRYDAVFSLTPFLKNEKEISQRIAKIEKGGGGNDAKCCVEECLQAANKLVWDPRSAKALVAIVDTYPNGVQGKSKKCQNGIHWSDEVERLENNGIKVYSIFAGDDDGVRDFYQKISDRTGGRLIPISDIHLMIDILVAIAMKETGNLEKYINAREQNGKITNLQKQTLLLLT